eukprot:5029253-Prymnesium_polylepis.1
MACTARLAAARWSQPGVHSPQEEGPPRPAAAEPWVGESLLSWIETSRLDLRGVLAALTQLQLAHKRPEQLGE